MWETGSPHAAQVMLQWFIRFLELAEITEFNESSAQFSQNAIVPLKTYVITAEHHLQSPLLLWNLYMKIVQTYCIMISTGPQLL